ncbi:MAG: hypothetical protein KJO84_07395 [Acidimicrobiia bacterium]|nr:hypothetical protein [Acidimicrobiia bacterium]
MSNVRVLEPSPSGEPQPPKRPNVLLGLAGIVIALVVLVLVTADFTGARTDAPPTTLPDLAGGPGSGSDLTTTTTEPARTLRQRVDDVAGPLLAVTRDISGTFLVVWEPDDFEPRSFGIPGLPVESEFDAAGRWLAIQVNATNGGTLLIGEPADLDVTDLWVTSFVWHDSEPGFISWVASNPDGAGPHVLTTGHIDPTTGSLVIDATPAEVGPGDRLVAAGDWGYLFQAGTLSEPFVPLLYVLDRDGARVASTPAAFVDNASFGRFLVISEMERYRATLDRSESEPPADLIELTTDGLAILNFNLVRVETDEYDVLEGQVISHDGQWLARVAPLGDIGTALIVDQLDGSIIRQMAFDDDVRLIGFGANDRFLLLQVDGGRGNSPLLVVEWRTGGTREIPFDADIQSVTVPLNVI